MSFTLGLLLNKKWRWASAGSLSALFFSFTASATVGGSPDVFQAHAYRLLINATDSSSSIATCELCIIRAGDRHADEALDASGLAINSSHGADQFSKHRYEHATRWWTEITDGQTGYV